MDQCILLSHLFIRKDENYKLDLLEFSLNHFRIHNPNAYIILTGHGMYPKNLDNVDYVFWEENVIEKEINKGHPFLVNKGFDHAIEKKFKKICKTRADGIHLITDLVSFCENKLKDKKILITQQTSFNQQMGDLFLYGDLDFLKKCWNLDQWYPTKTGLTSLANNFLRTLNSDNWKLSLKSNCNFIDIFNLKWIDFRSNWDMLKFYKVELLENKLDNYYQYLWGVKERWNVFDSQGNMIDGKNVITEKEWETFNFS